VVKPLAHSAAMSPTYKTVRGSDEFLDPENGLGGKLRCGGFRFAESLVGQDVILHVARRTVGKAREESGRDTGRGYSAAGWMVAREAFTP